MSIYNPNFPTFEPQVAALSVVPAAEPFEPDTSISPFYVPPELVLEEAELPAAQIYDMADYRRDSVDTNNAYSVNIVAVGDTALNADLYLAARQLRADVYIDEKKFLLPSARMADGGEMDEDDERSFHFAAAETIDGQDRIAGTARLIVKRNKDDLLPAERLFDIEPARVGSVESSRYIARHPDKRVQNAASLALIRAMTLQAVENGAPHLYAVLERPLFKMFERIGIPFEQISETRYVPEYNTSNFACRCDPSDIVPSVRAKDESRDMALAPFFDKVAATRGLGWFDKEF